MLKIPQAVLTEFRRRLALSCLTETQAKAAGLCPVPPDFHEVNTDGCWAMEIPYHKFSGARNGFTRYRLLEDPQDLAARRLAASKFSAQGLAAPRIPKYRQAAGSGVHLYVPAPALTPTPWPSVISDPTHILNVVEGELKTLCAAVNGLVAVGVGGVTSWMDKGRGFALLPEFDELELRKRTVRLIFDSDTNQREDLRQYVFKLGYELNARGAFVEIVQLPGGVKDEKVGLDDYLKEHGFDGFIENLAAMTVTLPMAKYVDKFNQAYAWVSALSQPARHSLTSVHILKSFTALQLETASQKTLVHNGFNAQGDLKTKEKKLCDIWLESPQRLTVAYLEFNPTQERFYVDDEQRQVLNLYTPSEVKPLPGDVAPFLALVDFIFTNEPADVKLHFMQWNAYHHQHPGEKLYQAYVFIGVTEGSGKSFLAELIRDTYGHNGMIVPSSTFFNSGNAWMASGALFAMSDELLIADERKKHQYDQLKDAITRDKAVINQKYVPVYEIRDTVSYIITSNHLNMAPVTLQDRRLAIIEAPDEKLDEKLIQDLRAWRADGGINYLLDYFLNLSTDGFKPKAAAPETNAKELMSDFSATTKDAWLKRLADNPQYVLKSVGLPPTLEIITSDRLWQVYQASGEDKYASSQSLGVSASRFFKRVNSAMYIRDENNERTRGFILQNKSRWLNSTHNQVHDYLVEMFPVRTRKF